MTKYVIQSNYTSYTKEQTKRIQRLTTLIRWNNPTLDAYDLT